MGEYTKRVMWAWGTIGCEWPGVSSLPEYVRKLEKAGATELDACPGWRVFESAEYASGRRDLIVLYIL